MTAHSDRGLPILNDRAGIVPDLVRQKGDSPLSFVALNPCFRLFACHWHDGTVPHLRRGCPRCAERSPIKLEGFLPAWSLHHGRLVVVGLSKSACSDLAVICEEHKGLRGQQLRMMRSRNSSNGRVRVVWEATRHPQGLPAAIDVVPTLLQVWQLPHAG